MTVLSESKRLKKELGLFKIYALATGATLSSGFFLLPGLAAAQAGPAVVLSYMIAAVHLVPAVFSMAELTTAMPRAGGIYYFVDRSMGPLVGTVGGLGTWLALVLKIAFALIGMGAYVGLLFPKVPVKELAIIFALVFGWINLFGAKKSGLFQIVLVVALLFILSGFMGHGLLRLRTPYFSRFFAHGFGAIYGTAGLVYISYVGLTNIASVSEEVKNPERNLPLGMFLALITAIVIYGLGTVVMTGLVPPAVFHNDLTPVASAAQILEGRWGEILVACAALLAFFSVSNAAILSASRYPLAMSRDHLFPRFFRFLGKHRTPKIAIYTTVALVILILLLFDVTKIAKLASAFQLLLFALSCLAVIIMRESKIESYDPGYRSPLYPWMQLAGILAPLFLIVEMGAYPLAFTVGLVSLGVAWYYLYAKKRVARHGAIYHIFARLGQRRFEGLDRELRGILKEKGLRATDPFDSVIAEADVLDLEGRVTFERVVCEVSRRLSKRLSVPPEMLEESFMQGTRVGATPVSHGAALPHMRLLDLDHPVMGIVRVRTGVAVDVDDEFLGEHASNEPVYAFFFLVSPEENPGRHLRLLAQIAGQVDDKAFIRRWLKAKNEQQMKELLLRDERFLSLEVKSGSNTAALVDKPIHDLGWPEGVRIALVWRQARVIIPSGRTTLRDGDRLTIIGEPWEIQQLRQTYLQAH